MTARPWPSYGKTSCSPPTLGVPILLRGESGTGKELVARAIHDAGPRGGKAYVAINMAALPPSLAAAELFGAERGAYTGADRRRVGHFEQAHGGTLFLDEVGETPVEVQALLLRTLETGEVRSVGGDRTTNPDVRILSATDADLDAAIEDGRFRGPLLHRLSGYTLRLPPLRRRREDFGRLFVHFLRRELEGVGKGGLLTARSRPWLPAPLVARLAAWHWPGNVRQLANVVRQLVIANRDADPANRFDEVESLLAATPSKEPQAPPVVVLGQRPVPRKQATELREDEVVAALRAHQFRPAAAADALGIPRSSIYDLMNKIPGLRKASDLSREEIDEARARVGPQPRGDRGGSRGLFAGLTSPPRPIGFLITSCISPFGFRNGFRAGTGVAVRVVDHGRAEQAAMKRHPPARSASSQLGSERNHHESFSDSCRLLCARCADPSRDGQWRWQDLPPPQEQLQYRGLDPDRHLRLPGRADLHVQEGGSMECGIPV